MTAECKEGVAYKSTLSIRHASCEFERYMMNIGYKKTHNAKHNDNLNTFKHFNNIICSIPGCKHESATTCIFKMCLDILCIDFKFL